MQHERLQIHPGCLLRDLTPSAARTARAAPTQEPPTSRTTPLTHHQAEAAAERYREAAADQDGDLFDGVPLGPDESGPGTSALGAIGGSDGAELAAAAAASLALTTGVGVEPIDE